MSMKKRRKDNPVCSWSKVLYIRQDYPDNYVDRSTFLSALQRSRSMSGLDMTQCLLAAGCLTQEVSLCCLCASLFFWLSCGVESSLVATVFVVFMLGLLSCLGLVLWNPKSANQVLGNCVVFLFFGFGFSPVLKDLTSTISTDTIYAMVVLACLLHLYVQDYGVQAPLVSTTLAFNASLFAAVCLASRLQTIVQAFTLLTFCAAVFAGSPLMHRLSLTWSTASQICLTFSLASTALVSVALLSYPNHCLTTCFPLLGLMVFLNGFCPWLFFRLQSYKEPIYGPWDEAVVQALPNE